MSPATEGRQVVFSRPIPGYLVAFDVEHEQRDRWKGTDVAFATRAAADQCLAGRLQTFPDKPFRVYALVALPDQREGLTVTAIRASVDAVADGGVPC